MKNRNLEHKDEWKKTQYFYDELNTMLCALIGS